MHLLPEHTFAFAKDGSLASVCDVPIAQVSVIFDGTVQPFNAALLDVPARDFNMIEFKNAGAASMVATGSVAAVNVQAKASVMRTSGFRVLRGGCWFFYARDCRSAYRLKRDPDLRNAIYGFRLACSEK